MKSKYSILHERLIQFSIDIIKFYRKLPNTVENQIIHRQIIRSSSSIGANYSEAMFAHSKNEFIHIMNICRKESNEANYWIILTNKLNSNFSHEVETLINETESILKIFISSVKTAKLNSTQ